MKVPKNLSLLAEFLRPYGKLYIVGGAVRNHLLHFSIHDYDICSNIRIDRLIEILANTHYIVKIKNAKLETAIIQIDDNVYEYATLRKEIYLQNGDRVPNEVIFTDSIKEDYKRRDFTCNALYYDICSKTLYDFCNGKKDIEEKIIKSVLPAEQTMSKDSLRILRMIRFASLLNFTIEEHTFSQACKYAVKLQKLSANRKLEELQYIVQQLKVNKLNFDSSMNLLLQTKTLNYIFAPELKRISYSLQDFSLSKSCKDEHIFECFLLDIFSQIRNQKNLSIKEIIECLLGNNGFNFKSADKKYFTKLFSAYSYLKEDKDVQFFIFLNNQYIDKFIEIFSYDFKLYDKLQMIKLQIKNMQEKNIPLKTKDLKINANMLIKHFDNLDKKKISYILDQCLIACIQEKIQNNSQILLQYCKKFL